MNSGLKDHFAMEGACGVPNAKRQTPNIKLQMVGAARSMFVWRLAFEVLRLKFGAAGIVVERMRPFVAASALKMTNDNARGEKTSLVERILASGPYQSRCILHISPCPSI